MLDLQNALLDLVEDVERLSRGISVSAAMAQSRPYSDGLEAVWEYLEQAQKQTRKDLDRCFEHMRSFMA